MQPPVFDKFQNENSDFKSIGKSLWVYFGFSLLLTMPFTTIDNGLSGIISTLTIVATILYCKHKTKVKFSRSDLHLNGSIKDLIKYFIIMTGFSMMALLIISFASTIFTAITHIDLPQAEISFDFSSVSGWIFLLYVCVVGPVFEELLFRGVILQTLKRYNAFFAIIASSLIFGLFHLYLEQGTHAFVLGIVLAYIAIKTDSLMVPILLHTIHNTLTTVTSFSLALSSGYIFFRFICMFIAIVWMINHYKQIKKEYAEDPISYPFFTRLFLRFSFISWFLLFIFETIISFI